MPIRDTATERKIAEKESKRQARHANESVEQSDISYVHAKKRTPIAGVILIWRLLHAELFLVIWRHFNLAVRLQFAKSPN